MITSPEPQSANASATGLTLSPVAAAVLHLPARVPLLAPTIPASVIRPWERAAVAVLVALLVLIWFMTTAPIAR